MNPGATSTIKHQVWIGAPVERVFDLIATARGWNQWTTSECVLEPRPGGRFEPEWRNYGPDSTMRRDEGRVLNLDAPRHIAFERTFTGGVRTRFTLDLRPDRDGTTVRLNDHGYPVGTHAEVIAFANYAAGWGEALALLKFCAEHGLRYRQPGEPAKGLPEPLPPVDDEPRHPPKRRRGKESATS
jgi:uncharacterized protein YndB with AHSA1/START domain